MATLTSSTTQKASILTRKFGLTPVVRCPSCQTECQKVKEKERKTKQPRYSCPTCKHEVRSPEKRSLPSDFFQKVAKATNILIKVGIRFTPELFERESLLAMKKFYNKAKKEPLAQALFNELNLHNRVQRCAAQYAYYAVREYHRRTQIVQLFTTLLLTKLQTASDLTILTQAQFPSRELVQEGRFLLTQELPEYGILSTAFLQNLWRHVRNLLLTIVVKQGEQENIPTFKELPFPKEALGTPLAFLQNHYEDQVKSFLRSFSRQLTSRVTRVVNRQSPQWGKGTFDPLLEEIIGKNSTEPLTLGRWEKKRTKWRDNTYERLVHFKTPLDFVKLGQLTFQQMKKEFSFPQLIQYVLSSRKRKPRVWYTLDVIDNWYNYLQRELKAQIWEEIANTTHQELLTLFKNACHLLTAQPKAWLKVPRFEKEALPYGADDGQVFQLWLDQEEPSTTASTKEQPRSVYVQLTTASRESYDFRLNTPQRFYQLLDQGHKWKKPVLTKSEKGTLSLAIPFQGVPNPKKRPAKKEGRMLGVDVGLKTLATLSVTEGLTPLKLPAANLTAKEYAQLFEGHSVTDFEIARYFLDQREVQVPAAKWWYLPKTSLKGRKNFKRTLYQLHKATAKMKSLQTQYKNRHPKTYKQKFKYCRLRRTWKRLWRKLRALHEELACQLAIRILSVATHHEVYCIRFEDLSWAQHSAKMECGYWLATWQVHWFYAQVQERVAELADRVGIKVETVNPRDTSQRCSHCGYVGKRQGKTFKCYHCGKQLDSDLNAARNLHLVPSSPSCYMR